MLDTKGVKILDTFYSAVRCVSIFYPQHNTLLALCFLFLVIFAKQSRTNTPSLIFQ